MTRETAFLVAAVRRFLHPGSALEDSGSIDWFELLRLASAHSVTPMLYAALRGVSVPAGVAADLRSSFESSVQSSLAQSGELARLAGLLCENNIDAIALKGPLLSHSLYGKLAARSSGDIDLLVKPGDVLAIRRLLVSREYRVANTFHWESDSAYLRSRENEMSFESPAGVAVDVHWRMLPRYFASPFDNLDVWKAAKTVTLAGRQVGTLGPEHTFLLLCSHSAKHAFERLGWICDIARFLLVTPGLDWSAILAQASRTRTLRQVLLAVRLATDMLGAAQPPGLPDDPIVAGLAKLVADRLLAGVVPPTPPFELNRLCLALLETPRQRLRYLIGQYITPSEAEYAALRLPPLLHFLYYPFRPVRLFAKHVVLRRA